MWRLWLSTMYNTMLSRPPLVHLANFQRGLTTRKSRRPSPNVTMFPTCMTPAWPYVGVARATSQSPLRSSVLDISHLADVNRSELAVHRRGSTTCLLCSNNNQTNATGFSKQKRRESEKERRRRRGGENGQEESKSVVL